MKKLLLVLLALCPAAFADKMPEDSPAFGDVTRVFIEAGAIKTGCGKLDEKGKESVCGYAEMSGSLVRRYVDLVLPSEAAISSWEADSNPERPFFYKSYTIEGNRLDILLWDVDENYTTLQFYYAR